MQPMHCKAASERENLVVEVATFIGIDRHKRSSVFHAVEAAGRGLSKGRIAHHCPTGFAQMLSRW